MKTKKIKKEPAQGEHWCDTCRHKKKCGEPAAVTTVTWCGGYLRSTK